jgi:hypothetical protein
MMQLELAFCSIKIRCHLNILKSRIKHHLGQVYCIHSYLTPFFFYRQQGAIINCIFDWIHGTFPSCTVRLSYFQTSPNLSTIF